MHSANDVAKAFREKHLFEILEVIFVTLKEKSLIKRQFLRSPKFFSLSQKI